MLTRLPILLIGLLVVSCYQPQRDCAAFKNGHFSFKTILDGEEKTTTFIRNDSMEIDDFEGKIDTSSVRWLNDCEYVVKKLLPKTKSEEKSIHIKILSTTDNSYTFEFNVIGDSKKSKGTAIKVN
jgi:hypothetical protein